MKLGLFGRALLALFASLTLGLGMTACGGGTIGFMWVLGQQYNQIAGFKIDDYTGNLTQIPHSPFTTNGSTPVSILVRPGGRYVYVLNQGTGGSSTARGSGSGVAEFSVGGDGVLTFQQSYQSQGYVPQYMQFDSTGSYLYVLDKYAPDGSGVGAITAYQVDGSTGRLQLILNTQSTIGGVGTTYFKTGTASKLLRQSGACLFAVNADNSISPFSFASGGQLANTTTTTFSTIASNITSLNGNGSYLIITDGGVGGNNRILPFTIASGCTLTAFSGGNTNNLTGTDDPEYSFIDNSGKYLYVLNSTTAKTVTGTPYSSISAFTINTSGGFLSPIAGSPYNVGSGPVCMVEDPSNQYLYVSNRNDGTVTGKLFDPNTGILSNLSRGSTFAATGTANCLGVSGAVN